MYYTLKTKAFRFKDQNVTEQQIKRAFIACYSNISFSTIPYLLYNYNSVQTLKIMNGGNCIALSLFLKKYLKDNFNVTSYLIPASIPKLYQDPQFLTLSHVALAVPISKTEVFVCDSAFYFQEPLRIQLTDGATSSPVDSIGIYDNTVNQVYGKMEFTASKQVLNPYQTIRANTYACVCHYDDQTSDTWKYYLTEITNPDQSIGTTFIQTKTRPFICSTKVRNGRSVMDTYLKYITDTEIKLEHNYKTLYTGNMLNIPDSLLQFINRKLFRYLKTDIQNIFRKPLNKKLVFS